LGIIAIILTALTHSWLVLPFCATAALACSAAVLYLKQRRASKGGAPAQRRPVPRSLRVLVVESDHQLLRNLVEGLGEYGSECFGTDDPGRALLVGQQWRPHLIVYGDLEGDTQPWIFAHRVLGNDSRPLDAPVRINRPYLVRLSASLDDRLRMLSHEFGFDECTEKPVDGVFLSYWIRSAYENRDKPR
jgi:hypothetical protein